MLKFSILLPAVSVGGGGGGGSAGATVHWKQNSEVPGHRRAARQHSCCAGGGPPPPVITVKGCLELRRRANRLAVGPRHIRRHTKRLPELAILSRTAGIGYPAPLDLLPQTVHGRFLKKTKQDNNVSVEPSGRASERV